MDPKNYQFAVIFTNSYGKFAVIVEGSSSADAIEKAIAAGKGKAWFTSVEAVTIATPPEIQNKP